MSIQPIIPIQSLSEISKIGQASPVQSKESVPFQSFFREALDNAKQSNEILEQETYKMATGQAENVHDIMIQSTKASLSVDLFVQLRNKALDAYNEIMRMGI